MWAMIEKFRMCALAAGMRGFGLLTYRLGIGISDRAQPHPARLRARRPHSRACASRGSRKAIALSQYFQGEYDNRVTGTRKIGDCRPGSTFCNFSDKPQDLVGI